MASSDPYKNNKLDYYSNDFINSEFMKVYKLKPEDIIRAADYRQNSEYDKEGVLEFNINLFICFVQNNEYHIHHYYEDFHWHHTKKFTFKLHKLFKFPFTILGKVQVEHFFISMAYSYENNDYLI